MKGQVNSPPKCLNCDSLDHLLKDCPFKHNARHMLDACSEGALLMMDQFSVTKGQDSRQDMKQNSTTVKKVMRGKTVITQTDTDSTVDTDSTNISDITSDKTDVIT